MIIIVSFLGFVTENIWLAFTKGYINNRNMNLPFLLGYGLSVVAIYLLLGTPAEMILFRKFRVKCSKKIKVLLYFLCVMICISIGEIVLGTVTEKLCHVEYWNYTRIPLHITKYTSIPTSIGFATLITLFMKNMFPLLMEGLKGIGRESFQMTVGSVLAILASDFMYCYGKMIKNKDFYKKWEKVIWKI